MDGLDTYRILAIGGTTEFASITRGIADLSQSVYDLLGPAVGLRFLFSTWSQIKPFTLICVFCNSIGWYQMPLLLKLRRNQDLNHHAISMDQSPPGLPMPSNGQFTSLAYLLSQPRTSCPGETMEPYYNIIHRFASFFRRLECFIGLVSLRPCPCT